MPLLSFKDHHEGVQSYLDVSRCLRVDVQEVGRSIGEVGGQLFDQVTTKVCKVVRSSSPLQQQIKVH